MKNHGRKVRTVPFSGTTFQTLARQDLQDWVNFGPALHSQARLEHYHRQLEGFIKKNTSIAGTSSSSRKEAALRLFRDYEVWNRQVNSLLGTWLDNSPRHILELIRQSSALIHNIVGDVSVSALRKMLEESAFGSGTTFGSKSRSDASLIKKLSEEQTVTPEALHYIRPLIKTNPAFSRWFNRVRVVKGNRVTTVPKTALVDRTIAIEPSVNVMLQKGVDYYLKSRLLPHGINLHDQSLGWQFAKQGSVSGSHATIDLSGASDCVSMAVVELLFPSDWVGLLDDLRSKYYYLGGDWHRYEKFASMGNATTFPVETTIFFAIARTCTDFCGGGEVVVYGDDIIVPRNSFLLTMEVLGLLGFFPNPDKSYGTGSFRETCGRDYYKGVDVRPIYVDKWPKDERGVYNLYNRLLNNRQGVPYDRALSYLFSLVPQPCLSPRYVGAGEDWMAWQQFKSLEFDAGFMVPGFWAGLRDRSRYDEKLHRLVYVVKQLRSKTGTFRYEGPLLLELSLYTGSSDPVDVGRTYYVVRKQLMGTFPSQGWWPSFFY